MSDSVKILNHCDSFLPDISASILKSNGEEYIFLLEWCPIPFYKQQLQKAAKYHNMTIVSLL